MKLKQKNLKALRLTKETLQELETPPLSWAQGGNRSVTTNCPSSNCCPHD